MVATYREYRSDVGVEVELLAKGDDRGGIANNLLGRRAGILFRPNFVKKQYTDLTEPNRAQSQSDFKILRKLRTSYLVV